MPLRTQRSPRRRATTATAARSLAVLAAALAATILHATQPEPPPAAAPQPSGMAAFIRADAPDDAHTIDLQVVSRAYLPVSGNGPAIHLVGVVHVGLAEYYAALQPILDSLDVVLFEGVKPAGMGDRPPLDDPAACARYTEQRLRLAASIVERFREREGRLPKDRAELIDASTWPSPSVVASILTDAWGNPIALVTADDPPYDLVSTGRDGAPGGEGHDADLRFSAQKPLDQDERASDDNIQTRLAKALGLAFQLHEINYDRPNFINSDLSIDEVAKKLDEAGGSSKGFLGMLSGDGFMGGMANLLIRMIDLSPQMRASTKVMMVMMLGSADIESAIGRGRSGEAFAKVIIHDRNDAVLRDLRKTLEQRPDAASIGIFYGAGHMPAFERVLLDEMGYTRGEERWLTAMRADLKEAGMTRAQAESMRKSMQRMMSPPAAKRPAPARP
ncbi:MAG: type II secretion system protein GspG [Phycisphaeraceae bacterium]|nr:MAG: type II secretion system protein GspG [Phycisphaeraceae bacterium]